MTSGPVFLASVRDLCWLVVLVSVAVRWWMLVSKTLDTPRSFLPESFQETRVLHGAPIDAPLNFPVKKASNPPLGP